MKTAFSPAVARPVAMIAIVLAVLISESVDATSILRGTLCDDQQPVQAELEEVITRSGIDRPELAILVDYGCTVQTILTGPTTTEDQVSRTYRVAWPQYRKAGELWFYDSKVCAYRDGVGPSCRATGEMARWPNGKPFRFDSEIQSEELGELATVLKDVFNSNVEIGLVRKNKWRGANWRTGERSYDVYIGTPPGFDSYVVTRKCKTIDRCSWDVSRRGRAHHVQ